MCKVGLGRLLRNAAVAALIGTASAQDSSNLVNSIVKAPVVPDGDVTGHSTDIVINLTTSLDPSVPGRTLLVGKTIKVTLPDSFRNTGALPFGLQGSPGCPPGCNTMILLQGWPQHAIVPLPARYTETYDGASTITLTATSDIRPAPPFEPGIKQLHLLLPGFTNPDPGDYQIQVTSETGSDGTVETGWGNVRILPATRPSVNIASALFMPAGLNAIYQTTKTGQMTPRPFDLLLWDRNGAPLLDVTVESDDSGGLLLQGDRVVGLIYFETPLDATGQRAFTIAASGPVNAPASGVPAALLRVFFQAGSVPGNYTATFTLTGGYSASMFITAQ